METLGATETSTLISLNPSSVRAGGASWEGWHGGLTAGQVLLDTPVCASQAPATPGARHCAKRCPEPHFYLRVLENVFSYGIQVRGVLDVADIVSHSLDHHVTWRQDQLVGPDLRKQAQMSIA